MSKKEIPGILLTASRYGFAEIMARHVKDGKPIAAEMAGLIATDIMDGEILRQFDLDTPTRRVADGIVGHVCIGRVMVETARKYPESRLYIGIIATRAAIVGALGAYHLATTNEVTKGNGNQRATNLATAVFALAANSGNKKLTHLTGVVASGVAIATLPAYFKGLGTNHSENGIRDL